MTILLPLPEVARSLPIEEIKWRWIPCASSAVVGCGKTAKPIVNSATPTARLAAIEIDSPKSLHIVVITSSFHLITDNY